MIGFIKNIWSGSLAVKISVVFLTIVFVICLIGDPGRTIFTGLFVAAVFAILNRISDLEEQDNE